MRRFSWSHKLALKPLPPADSTPLPRFIEMSHSRLMVVAIVFALAFVVLAFRLCEVALFSKGGEIYQPRAAVGEEVFERGEILDRMGTLVAVNLETASLYANPKIILDVNEAVEKLHKVFPELLRKQLRDELSSTKSFVWIKRNLTPKEQYAVNNLGIPGLFFERGEKRIYPHGRLLAHVLGYVGLDGKGL